MKNHLKDELKNDLKSSCVEDVSKKDFEKVFEPKAPFPGALKGSISIEKQKTKTNEIIDVFRQVKINLPLLYAIKQIPTYAKFLKDLCTQKRKNKSQALRRMILTEQVSSILQHNTLPKFKDPGSPTTSCIIGDHVINRALLDLGASVNRLPYSVYVKLGLGDLKSTSVVLQLASRSIKKPRGIIEDVLIKIDKFFFPVDFVVIDTEPILNPKNQIPVILGLPFLVTANANINCRTGIMKISFGHMKVKLNIFNPTSNSMDKHEEVCVVEKCLDNECDKVKSLLGSGISKSLSSNLNSRNVVSKPCVERA
ncbi:uncharacterized protein LOC132311969 [Cornus florida]|uniref:uncharacterized protein LOC132311969 n=1 Tax=Cornus florida TaxID=4283 RepID=UPI002897CE10|nr:uncharacterized protein LOC132311969 [Cornus florida]XP_059666140.1 uncharacterized protein LOC132311969 [Cornus florida]